MTTYTVDPVHTNVIFKIRHAGVTNFYGRFDQVDGSVEFDGDDITNSTMSFKIPVKSANTNSRTRDGHIQDAEFFNARQFKYITFESTSIESDGDDGYVLTGDLTLHGITKEITATLRDVRTGVFRDHDVLGFEARFSILRSDFEIMKYLAKDLSDSGPLGNTVELIVAVESGVQ
jgi:polyisoprenoid-binding protein YceI